VFAVVPAVIVLEGASVTAAFRRSWRLVTKDFWRTLATLVLATVISLLLGLMLVLPFFIVGGLLGVGVFASDTGSLAAIALSAAAGLVSGTVTAPFIACVRGLLYVDRRIRAEGLDIALAQNARLADRTAGR
jgi:hypothetical protein